MNYDIEVFQLIARLPFLCGEYLFIWFRTKMMGHLRHSQIKLASNLISTLLFNEFYSRTSRRS